MKKVGIALSGGGSRGIVHLGILKAIDEAGIKIDMITGTSAGAIGRHSPDRRARHCTLRVVGRYVDETRRLRRRRRIAALIARD